MNKWGVVCTQPQKEDIALHHLDQQGFVVYCPRFKKQKRHSRKVEIVLAPLFPRYIFVRIDTDVHAWRSINGTRGVQQLLHQDNQPKFISDAVIRTLKERETAEGLVPIESLALFIKGAAVEITDGAFKGKMGVFEKFSDKDRAMILLEFLGREMKVPVNIHKIKPV